MKSRIVAPLVLTLSVLVLNGCRYGMSFSPSGAQLVAVDRDGLHIIAANGAGFTIIPHSENATQPSWSPDGRWIAFGKNPEQLNDNDQRPETWLYSTATRRSHILSKTFGAPFAWREDGAQLAAICSGDKKRNAQLVICEPASGTTVMVVNLPFAQVTRPLWVPNTSMLLVEAGEFGDLYLVEGNECRRLTTTGNILGAGVSRDGRYALWLRTPKKTAAAGWEVYRYDLSQSRMSRLPFPKRVPLPRPASGYTVGWVAAVVAPSAERIAAGAAYCDSPTGDIMKARHIYTVIAVMRMDGSGAVAVQPAAAVARRWGLVEATWSIDGNRIAVHEFSSQHANDHLYTYSADGRGGKLIYNEPGR